MLSSGLFVSICIVIFSCGGLLGLVSTGGAVWVGNQCGSDSIVMSGVRVSNCIEVLELDLTLSFSILVRFAVWLFVCVACVISERFVLYFLHEMEVWPIDLHAKHVILSSVKKILNCVSSWVISSDPGSFAVSSGFRNICLRKLNMWSYPVALTPALR